MIALWFFVECRSVISRTYGKKIIRIGSVKFEIFNFYSQKYNGTINLQLAHIYVTVDMRIQLRLECAKIIKKENKKKQNKYK
jgi:hypothetical protein